MLPSKINGLNLLCCWLVFSLFYACGNDGTDNLSHDSQATGGYQCSLVFPATLPQAERQVQSADGVDCDAAGITTVSFSFYDNNDQLLATNSWPCSYHKGTVENIPVGSNIRLVVEAESEAGSVLLTGEEASILIEANRTTTGGEIAMEYYSDTFDASDTYTNTLGMSFVRIPPGSFVMGSPATESGRDSDEAPHWVTLTNSFYMQTTEMTQAQWTAVMDDNPSNYTACGDNCPVDSVSWNDIQDFLEILNQSGQGTYRLPTEAEWEYAARAQSDAALCNGAMNTPGTNSDTSCANQDANLSTVGWYCANSESSYTPCSDASERGGPDCVSPKEVAQKRPNAWNLYDMHGNVYEWCQDWYQEVYSSGPDVDPEGADTGSYKVLRSGSYFNAPRYTRSASRYYNEPHLVYINYGFRLVYVPDSQ